MKQTSSPHIFQVGNAAPKPKAPTQMEMNAALTLFQQGRMQELEQSVIRLTKQYPDHGFGWKILGVALRMRGQLQASLKPMQTAAKLLPTDHEAFSNLGSTLQALGDPRHAEACYRHAITVKPDYAEGVLNLANMLANLGRRDEALELYERKVALTPDDEYARHMTNILRGQQTDRAPAQYVAKTFDDYAETFDSHLVSQLNYQAPQRLVDAIIETGQAPEGKWRVLDLGCGTGLSGAAIAPHASELVGIDLSQKMLDKARAKNLYQSLICADILPTMQSTPASSFDVILATDVFVYVGKLDEVAKEARRLLRAGGVLAFSTEDIDLPEQASATQANVPAEPDYQMKPNGRYGHSLAYLDRLAESSGFKSVSRRASVVRTEGGQAVKSQLVVWRA